MSLSPASMRGQSACGDSTEVPLCPIFGVRPRYPSDEATQAFVMCFKAHFGEKGALNLAQKKSCAEREGRRLNRSLLPRLIVGGYFSRFISLSM